MSGMELMALLIGGALLALYHLADKWLDGKNEVATQEAERQRLANEAAEFELEQRKDAYYDNRQDA